MLRSCAQSTSEICPSPVRQAILHEAHQASARLLGVVLFMFCHIEMMRSTLLDSIPFPRTHGPRDIFDLPLEPVQMLWALLLAFLFLLPRFAPPTPSPNQVPRAAILYCSATILAVLATHVAPPVTDYFEALRHTASGKALLVFLFAPLAYLLQLLPFVAISSSILPEDSFRKHRFAMAGISAAIAGFAALHAVEILWEKWLVGPDLFLTRALLSPVLGFQWSSAFDQTFVLGSFSVKIAAPCAGLVWVFFFAAAYVCGWIILTHRRSVSCWKAWVGLVGGVVLLYMLNAIRIALLLAVGAFSADLSMGLFHSLLGASLSFLVFLGYLRFVFPWMVLPAQAIRKNA